MGNQFDELIEAVKTGRLLFESAFYFSQFSPASKKLLIRLHRGHQYVISSSPSAICRKVPTGRELTFIAISMYRAFTGLSMKS